MIRQGEIQQKARNEGVRDQQIEKDYILSWILQGIAKHEQLSQSIVRYDCAHGFFHRDVLMPNGDKEKKSIEIDSLKNASKYAEQDLKDRWEWYKDRYIKKLNKK